jgi:hypothetical protein
MTTEGLLEKMLGKMVECTVGQASPQRYQGTLVGWDDKGVIITQDYHLEDLPPERYLLFLWRQDLFIVCKDVGGLSIV